MKCARPSCPLPAGPSGFCDMHAHEELNRLRANPTQALLPEELAPIRTCRDELNCFTVIGLARRVDSLRMMNGRLGAEAERRRRRPRIEATSAQRKPPVRAVASAGGAAALNSKQALRLGDRSNLWEAFIALGNAGAA